VLKLFAILDTKAAIFQRPFCAETRATALRALETVVNREGEQSDIALYPQDFELFELGTFDQESGELVSTGRVSVTNLMFLRKEVDA